MSLKSWWQGRKSRRRLRAAEKSSGPPKPLREFVYLDEVSLQSLLVSQNDTIPEQVTSAISFAEQAELSAKIKADAVAVKSEVGSRYQTTNSNSVQSSRKAIVQTLFNEFRDASVVYGIREGSEQAPVAASLDEIPSLAGEFVKSEAELRRGSLVEISVTLDADDVFKLGTMVTEFSEMANDFPEMAGPQGLAVLREIEPMTRVIDRLLAGLIPIRATAVNHCVVSLSGTDYVVHKDVVRDLDVDTRPLVVVGVTEHVGYWKDIRRVLFSGGEFTVLCRLGRSGLQDSWTAVKLADLFSDVAPAFVEQMSSIGRIGMEAAALPGPAQAVSPIHDALTVYCENLVVHVGEGAVGLDADEIDELAAGVGASTSPTAQRQAFLAAKRALIERNPDLAITDAEDLLARQDARQAAGLAVLPVGQSTAQEPSTPPAPGDRKDERLLDVEVIALYW